jgi:hypothetical protein
MATQQTTGSKRKAPTPTRGSAARSVANAPSTSPSGAAERDEVYGLVSVLYHALQGAETYGKYVEDAQKGDDPELLEFFKECQQEENERAQRAKRLLATRLEEFADEDEDDDEGDEDDDDDEEDDEED